MQPQLCQFPSAFDTSKDTGLVRFVGWTLVSFGNKQTLVSRSVSLSLCLSPCFPCHALTLRITHWPFSKIMLTKTSFQLFTCNRGHSLLWTKWQTWLFQVFWCFPFQKLWVGSLDKMSFAAKDFTECFVLVWFFSLYSFQPQLPQNMTKLNISCWVICLVFCVDACWFWLNFAIGLCHNSFFLSKNLSFIWLGGFMQYLFCSSHHNCVSCHL